MAAEVRVLASPEAIGEELAREIAARHDSCEGPFLPGCPGGRSLRSTYVDVFLAATGASDGHVAFVPPGSPRHGRTAVVELAEPTPRNNLATFPRFASVDEVPTHGVSVGLGTIAAARSLRLVLHGAEKRVATRRLLELDRFDRSRPASVVHEHADAVVYVDDEACG